MLSLISFSLSFIFSKIPKLKCKSSLCHPSIKPKNTSPFGIIYSISFPPLQASNNGVSLIDNVMPRENGLSDQKVVLNNPLAFRDDYLNKYFQNCSEFIQFFTSVRILVKPREFSLSRKMCLCLVEAWEACFPFRVCCVFVWSRFEFLLTRRPPFSSSSLPFSFHGGLDLDPPTTPVLDSLR